MKGKRIADIVFSSVSIIGLSPLMIIISIIVKVTIPGSVFFSQKRVGKNRQIFNILKFRTITDESGVADDKRATGYISSLGQCLRRTKLDELPQLINILIGDMSFVGPRPYIPEESENLPDERFDVLPGLTGLAQVNGNTHLSWEERTEYDIEYIRKWSPMLDLGIILKTVKVVMKGEEACVRHLD